MQKSSHVLCKITEAFIDYERNHEQTEFREISV